MAINIGIVDDHQLFITSIKSLLETNDEFHVILEALSGQELQAKLGSANVIPDIVLVDVNMPDMNGVEIAKWLRENYPAVKVAALSQNRDENTIIKMVKEGACAYLFKHINYQDLERAIYEIHKYGFYNSDQCKINFLRMTVNGHEPEVLDITDKELTFLQFACSDMTYDEIAVKMNCSVRTVDYYRECLFGKLKVKSKVGMVLEALRKGLVEL